VTSSLLKNQSQEAGVGKSNIEKGFSYEQISYQNPQICLEVDPYA
jgi:hypothetical protein